MKFKIVSDYKEAKELWQMFSPNQCLWDLWEVRDCFIRGTNYPLYFIVGYEGDEILGILPLWYNPDQKYYSFIGDDLPEENKLFLKDKKLLPEFLKQCPDRTYLEYLNQDDKNFFPSFKIVVHPDDCYYHLNLTGFNSFEDYLQSFGKKHRKNLKYDLNGLSVQGFTADLENNFEENIIDIISRYNLGRFKDDSFFATPSFSKSLLNLILLTKEKGELHMVVIKKLNQIYGAQFAILHKGVYTVIMGGHDSSIKNLGKLLTVGHIKNAVNLGIQEIDFMAGGEWKQLWQMFGSDVYEWDNSTGN
ncbi:MAG: GNAT family N-acetyltransferase [Patescibacteria group bacterium]|nr:GNAT family N-acetyltransferase [Patescibacteria group bacterium]MDD5163997.1 GNAT family N-acetyltransferase [Patescibacteria group bacterium]MDD5534919.1 GNAT family N-acetyltransferase [Patescibacteria group bacterium]